jgi:1-acyl-sn-glycerol-3-phosphate acyltransferase
VNLDRLASSAAPRTTAGRPSRAVVALLRWGIGPLVRILYRPTLEGLENLPPSGPFLLVANHAGAMGIAEIMSFAVLYLGRFGTERPIAGFAHPFGFHLWPISWLMRGLGAIPSSYAAGEATLAAGVPLLVFPGGDREAARPIWYANTVDFGGRVGFLKLARKARIPVVPLGFRGSHLTAPILWQSRVLPYLYVLPALFRIKRFPLTLLALAGAAGIVIGLPALGAWRFALAYAWLASPFTMIPWVPWTVRARVGRPIAHAELFPPGSGEDAPLGAALARVEAEVRAMVDARP